MLKKLAGMGLSLALAGTVLAGCGSGHNTGNDNTGSKAAATYVPKELNVQFVPSQNDASDLQAKSHPLEQLLSDKLGIPVHVSVSTTYNSIIEAMASKQIDIGFIPASGYIIAHDQKHAANIILQAERYGVHHPDGKPTHQLVTTYQAMILVRKDSGIKSLKDLKGKKIAWQDPTSPAGYVWPAVEMKKAGVDPVTDVQGDVMQGHGAAIQALVNKQVDAAAVFDDARNIVKKDIPNIFDITTPLYYTAPIPNDTICVRPDMDPTWVRKIQQAFMDIADAKKNPEGHKMIESIYTHEGYQVADDHVFDIARAYQKELDNQ
ncbi:phosphate/phosphite/phosphonate ABC transporter substrate-binding protein [Alicyclobacillus pomorum]|jgi:phosphonate transport system substrate-binding protein|uniref:phosphate/phosphite/phosphonate ABC transporter substrate-binding protein n=1 Tax=Alicyclobacillus pomorum TaxID=204470 RepID=UPI00041083FE|nr:phosphate/phosphite/phosphonate ABC transporter substrate-binding protein [Alicyclobacillus pomorum]